MVYFYYTHRNRLTGKYLSVVNCDTGEDIYRFSYMIHASRGAAYRYARSMAHSLRGDCGDAEARAMSKRAYQRGL